MPSKPSKSPPDWRGGGNHYHFVNQTHTCMPIFSPITVSLPSATWPRSPRPLDGQQAPPLFPFAPPPSSIKVKVHSVLAQVRSLERWKRVPGKLGLTWGTKKRRRRQDKTDSLDWQWHEKKEMVDCLPSLPRDHWIPTGDAVKFIQRLTKEIPSVQMILFFRVYHCAVWWLYCAWERYFLWLRVVDK